MKAKWWMVILALGMMASPSWSQNYDPSDPEDVAAGMAQSAPTKTTKKKSAKKTKSKKVAKPAPKKGSGLPPQGAVIGVEGATVYQSPDFDSKVIVALPPGLKVSSSHRTFPGKGGLGLFYRVSYEKGRTGYVADTELIPEFKRKGKRPEKNPVFDDVESLRERALSGQEPIYMSRYMGVVGGMWNFTEKFKGRRVTSQDMLYGLRFSGPGVLSEVLPIDLNILFAPKPPSYYGLLSRSAPSGFYVNTELSFLIPFAEENHYMLYGGLGVSTVYTKFRLEVEPGVFVDAQEVRVGGVGTLGLALRFGKWALRGDMRYYYEATSYLGFWGSLQHEF